ncbi:hypothetical protein BKA63DRAFT_288161 [Paraphoma chrysanthemicola]|nr:hypothetical protein BKA63DRAFT_288161 [Paraphoma chrysanthemicola]
MLTRPLFSLFTSLSLIQSAFAVTQIALFSDSNCQNSLRGVEGPNGYPNGTCTDFRRTGSYGSFHVVGMDPGCTVTIYADDYSGDICSSTAPQLEINLVDCYNSSYIFYSIDWCNSPRSATPLPSASPSAKVSTGAIVGGVVGGVVVLGILIGFGVCIWKRKRGNDDAPQEVNGTGVAELSYEPKPMEMDGESGMMAYKRNAEVQVQVQREPIEIGDCEVGREYGYQYGNGNGNGYGAEMGMEQEGLSGTYGSERNMRYYRR